MTFPFELFDREIAARIVAVLAHSLWQAPLLAVLAWFGSRRLPARRANARYVVSLAALVAVLMAAAGTWRMMAEQSSSSRSLPASPNPSLTHPAEPTRSANATNPIESAATEVAGGQQRSDFAPGKAGGDEPSTALLAQDWHGGIVIAWLLGVCLMLIRMTRAVHGTLALAADSVPLPERITALVQELCERMGISRRVVVVASERICLPGVVGAVWPTLMLPVSMLTGLPPEDLRAIIAHELAHIRRYDYAVNLVQMFIESLFFFNPAVWWISRRIRIEREACADAAVVTLTGKSMAYAALLANVAERLPHGTPMPVLVGLAERRSDGTLLERVRRVVEPGEFPNVRLPWGSLLLVLLVSAAAVAAIWQGTSATVGLAQELMTDQQRVETIAAEREQFAPARRVIGEGQGTIRGTIRTEDDRPLPKEVWLYYQSRRDGNTTMGTLKKVQNEFTASVSSGTVWLLAEADGYAPVYAGPFQVAPDEEIQGVEIVLPVGFKTSIHVTSEKGLPIAGAKITGGLLQRGGSIGGSGGWTTDADGFARLAHAATGPYRITVTQPGYQPLQKDVSFAPDRPLEVPLAAADPFLGHVVSADGEPVGGAKVRFLYERRPKGGGNDHGNWGPNIGTTDDQGRFKLDQLTDGWQYVLLVESESWGRTIVAGVAAGKVRTVTMGPRLKLRGEITGPLNELERDRRGPYAMVFQAAEFRLDGPHTSSLYEKVPVQIKDGVGTFECSNLMSGEVTVQAGKQRAKTTVSAVTPSATVRIDLSAPVPVVKMYRRRVVLQLVRDSRPALLDGTVRIFGHATENTRETVSEILSLSDGRVAVDVPVPGRVQCSPLNIVGWYFEEVSAEVSRGKEPLRIDIPVVPAGAVKGRVTLPAGYASGDEPMVSVWARWKDETQEFPVRQDTISATADSEGRFFVTPIPLGAECSVKVTAGHNIQVSEVFSLDAARPLREVELRLPKTVSAVVRVVDPAGHPVPDLLIKLHWERSGASGNVWNVGITDRDGRVTVADVNAEAPQYFVGIDSRRKWQPSRALLRVDGSMTTIELKRGQELAGTVIDDASGFPVPGVEVCAIRRPVSIAPFDTNTFEAEAGTDEHGRYRFSNLPDANVHLIIRGMMNLTSDDRDVQPGRGQRIDLRGEIPAWSDLRPRPPKE